MITARDLLTIGLEEGPDIGKYLEFSKSPAFRSLPKEEIIREILRDKESQPKLLELRQTPLPIAAAVEYSTKEEEENVFQSLEKMKELSLCPIIDRLAVMPDTCPSGQEFGCIPVGGAIQTSNHILPSAHSADVCCSMRASFIPFSSDHKRVLDALEKATLFGPFGRKKQTAVWHPILEENVWENPFLKGLEETAHEHLQTQGDGNHFAFLGEIGSSELLYKALDKEGYCQEAKSLKDNCQKDTKLLAIVTHHGSRKLGAEVYKRGIKQAQISTNKVAKNIPKELCWLDINAQIGKHYWQALEYVQRWTIANHNLIHDQTLSLLATKEILRLGNAHNFVWKHNSNILHGKGATPAWLDNQGRKTIGIIPLNMSSDILLTFGNDQSQFLSFSPHGAGRNRSRTKTLAPFINNNTKNKDTEAIKAAISEATLGLDIRWASNRPDISESPLGYKSPQEVKRQLEKFSLATIICSINPKGCIMAGEFDQPWKKVKTPQANSPKKTIKCKDNTPQLQ